MLLSFSPILSFVRMTLSLSLKDALITKNEKVEMHNTLPDATLTGSWMNSRVKHSEENTDDEYPLMQSNEKKHIFSFISVIFYRDILNLKCFYRSHRHLLLTLFVVYTAFVIWYYQTRQT